MHQTKKKKKRINAPNKRHRLDGWMKTHVHVCTSTYHILPLNPPNCMWLFYIVRLIMFPLWLAIVIIFLFFVHWLWKLINFFYYCDYITIIHLKPLYHESEVTQSCPTLCDPMDCSLSGSSVHGIFQAKVLEWIAISFSRGSSRPRNRTQVSRIAGRRFTVWATREAVTIIHSKPLYHDWSTEIIEFYIIKLPFNRKTCNQFLKSKCISELSWNCMKNTNAEVLLFSPKLNSRCVSNKQTCLQTIGLYDDLLSSLFHFFYFISSARISFSLFFQFLSLVFCCSFSSLYQV